MICDCKGGGTIKGATSGCGGACIYLYNSTLDIFGGKITGGKVSGNGGGGAIALDDSKCIMNMTGGIISGNIATGNGGAVYIYRSRSICNLSGGTIENNTAKSGGGIYVNPSNNGQLKISGNPVVKGNTVSDAANNVYLFAQFPIEDYAEVHVIDLRFFRDDIAEYAKANGISNALVLYGVQNFVKDTNLS